MSTATNNPILRDLSVTKKERFSSLPVSERNSFNKTQQRFKVRDLIVNNFIRKNFPPVTDPHDKAAINYQLKITKDI